MAPGTVVKCLVWDLDGTIWPDVAIEATAGAALVPYPRALAAMTLLEQRGIVNSLASRTDPVVAATVRTHPDLAGRFVAPQLSWDHKSDAIARIAAELGIATSALALVDDNPFERAEVTAVLPDVLVLSPDELYERLDGPEFRPAVITEDARQRPDRYRAQERRRTAGRDFTGTRDAFLQSCDIRLAVGVARAADIARVGELVDRTHRFNSTGERWPPEKIGALLADPAWWVLVARLQDRFGDYGLIGTVLVHRELATVWRVPLLMVSCRAAGRDVPRALLRWVNQRARARGVERLLVDVRPSEANLELRVLLRAVGFAPTPTRAVSGPTLAGRPPRTGPDSTVVGGTVLLTRPTQPDPPVVPWLRIVEDGAAR